LTPVESTAGLNYLVAQAVQPGADEKLIRDLDTAQLASPPMTLCRLGPIAVSFFAHCPPMTSATGLEGPATVKLPLET